MINWSVNWNVYYDKIVIWKPRLLSSSENRLMIWGRAFSYFGPVTWIDYLYQYDSQIIYEHDLKSYITHTLLFCSKAGNFTSPFIITKIHLFQQTCAIQHKGLVLDPSIVQIKFPFYTNFYHFNHMFAILSRDNDLYVI